jgi:hypothetical protein
MVKSCDDWHPVVFDNNVKVVKGGMLGKDKPVMLHTTEEQGATFWTIHVTSAEACALLTGQPKCYRPLAGLDIFKRLRTAISLARNQADESVGALGVEDLWGESVEDQQQGTSPDKKGKTDRGKHMQSNPILKIDMPLDDSNLLAGVHEIRVLNCRKEIAIEFSIANLNWLMRAVARDMKANKLKATADGV